MYFRTLWCYRNCIIIIRLNQSLLEFINIPKNIPKRRRIDSLLHYIANIVSEWIEIKAVEGHRSREMKFVDVFLFISMHISLFLFSVGSAETEVG